MGVLDLLCHKGALALIFFYQGIFWRQEKTARYALRDGVFLSALTLLWVLCCLLAPWERGTWEKKEWLPWLLLLLAMAGGAAFSWRQYFCRRRSEAAAAPEEGGFAPAAPRFFMSVYSAGTDPSAAVSSTGT